MIYQTGDEYAHHYTTDAVRQFGLTIFEEYYIEMIIIAIPPSLQMEVP